MTDYDDDFESSGGEDENNDKNEKIGQVLSHQHQRRKHREEFDGKISSNQEVNDETEDNDYAHDDDYVEDEFLPMSPLESQSFESPRSRGEASAFTAATDVAVSPISLSVITAALNISSRSDPLSQQSGLLDVERDQQKSNGVLASLISMSLDSSSRESIKGAGATALQSCSLLSVTSEPIIAAAVTTAPAIVSSNVNANINTAVNVSASSSLDDNAETSTMLVPTPTTGQVDDNAVGGKKQVKFLLGDNSKNKDIDNEARANSVSKSTNNQRLQHPHLHPRHPPPPHARHTHLVPKSPICRSSKVPGGGPRGKRCLEVLAMAEGHGLDRASGGKNRNTNDGAINHGNNNNIISNNNKVSSKSVSKGSRAASASALGPGSKSRPHASSQGQGLGLVLPGQGPGPGSRPRAASAASLSLLQQLQRQHLAQVAEVAVITARASQAAPLTTRSIKQACAVYLRQQQQRPRPGHSSAAAIITSSQSHATTAAVAVGGGGGGGGGGEVLPQLFQRQRPSPPQSPPQPSRPSRPSPSRPSGTYVLSPHKIKVFLGDLWAADEHASQGLGPRQGQGLEQRLPKRALSAPTAMALSAVHQTQTPTHDTAGDKGKGRGRGVRFSDCDDHDGDDNYDNNAYKNFCSTANGKNNRNNNNHDDNDDDDDDGLGSRQSSRQLIDGPFEPRQPPMPRPDRQLRFNTAPTPSQPPTSTASAPVPVPAASHDPIPGPSSRTGSAPGPSPSPDPGDALVAELRALRLEAERRQREAFRDFEFPDLPYPQHYSSSGDGARDDGGGGGDDVMMVDRAVQPLRHDHSENHELSNERNISKNHIQSHNSDYNINDRKGNSDINDRTKPTRRKKKGVKDKNKNKDKNNDKGQEKMQGRGPDQGIPLPHQYYQQLQQDRHHQHQDHHQRQDHHQQQHHQQQCRQYHRRLASASGAVAAARRALADVNNALAKLPPPTYAPPVPTPIPTPTLPTDNRSVASARVLLVKGIDVPHPVPNPPIGVYRSNSGGEGGGREGGSVGGGGGGLSHRRAMVRTKFKSKANRPTHPRNEGQGQNHVYGQGQGHSHSQGQRHGQGRQRGKPQSSSEPSFPLSEPLSLSPVLSPRALVALLNSCLEGDNDQGEDDPFPLLLPGATTNGEGDRGSGIDSVVVGSRRGDGDSNNINHYGDTTTKPKRRVVVRTEVDVIHQHKITYSTNQQEHNEEDEEEQNQDDEERQGNEEDEEEEKEEVEGGHDRRRVMARGEEGASGGMFFSARLRDIEGKVLRRSHHGNDNGRGDSNDNDNGDSRGNSRGDGSSRGNQQQHQQHQQQQQEPQEEQEEEEDYAYENDGFEDVDEDTGIDATGKAKPVSPRRHKSQSNSPVKSPHTHSNNNNNDSTTTNNNKKGQEQGGQGDEEDESSLFGQLLDDWFRCTEEEDEEEEDDDDEDEEGGDDNNKGEGIREGEGEEERESGVDKDEGKGDEVTDDRDALIKTPDEQRPGLASGPGLDQGPEVSRPASPTRRKLLLLSPSPRKPQKKKQGLLGLCSGLGDCGPDPAGEEAEEEDDEGGVGNNSNSKHNHQTSALPPTATTSSSLGRHSSYKRLVLKYHRTTTAKSKT